MKKRPIFKISIKPTRLFYIAFLLVYLFIIFCECELLPFSRRGYSVVALFFIFFSLVRFELRRNPIVDILLPIANSFVVTLVLQLMLSCDPRILNTPTLIGNVALNAGFCYLFLLLTNSIKWSLGLTDTLLFGFAFIDYMVISFRKSEIKFSDIYSIKTGASVVGQYKLELTSRVNYAIIVFVAILFVVAITKLTVKSKRNQLPRITGVLALGISLFTVSYCMNNSTNYMQLWATDGIKYNGLTYNFLIEARDSRVEMPEGYSNERAEELFSRYSPTQADAEQPNIIVVMSEAFADLSVLGEFETSDNPMEFYNSLKENCTKGYLMSSVFGGNTASSEWEFLTGNTQAFLPYGSVAYQQYIKTEANTIVEVMEDNGYTTVAMHPFLSTGWKRNIVYDVFGFDEVYFQDELSGDEKIRGFVSDRTLFRDIAERLENKKKGEKLFTFAITMQNHGGYEYGNFESEVTVEGIDVLSANQYLTLLKKSDDALRELIGALEGFDEKTMLVLFGDHHPSLNSAFYSHVMGDTQNTYQGTMKKYTVPFMIWTNYDTPEEENLLSSINFLPVMMMKKAGVAMPEYFVYLDELHSRMPAVSFFAYYSESEKKLKRPSEATGGELDLLNEYRLLQYYNVFK